jgi:prepilin-type N-terminal cleavage/methylation domain-containing protein
MKRRRMMFNQMPMPRKAKENYFFGVKGFTLIEIIVVLIIISVITAIAVGRMNFNVNLPAETDKFKSNLRYAQHIALSSDQNNMWSVTVTDHSYSLTRTNSTNSVNIPFPGGGGDSTINFPGGVNSGGTSTVINFDRWGSPGNTTITIPMTDGIATNVITVTKRTGFIP